MGWIARGRRLAVAAAVPGDACSPAGRALARTVLDLDPDRQPVPLQDWGDAWIDTTGRRPWTTSPRDAPIALAADRAEQRSTRSTRGKALWVRFTVPPAPDSERWYLEVPYPGGQPRHALHAGQPPASWIAAVGRRHVAGRRLARAAPPSRCCRWSFGRGAARATCCASRTRTASARRCSSSAKATWAAASSASSLDAGHLLRAGGAGRDAGACSAPSRCATRAYRALRASASPLMGLTPGRHDRHRPACTCGPTGRGGTTWRRMVLPVLAVGALQLFFAAVVSLPRALAPAAPAVLALALLRCRCRWPSHAGRALVARAG